MNYENIQVADVCLKVGFEWGDLGLHEHFPNGNENSQVILNVNLGYPLNGSQIRPNYNDGKMDIWISDGDGSGLDFISIMRHIGYLAGDLSEKYRFCHGAGLNINGKGVLLIGNSGNGKSTLASILGGKLLDDDILITTPSEMRRIAKVGGRIDRKTGSIEFTKDDSNQSALHYVFLLNNGYDPDHIARIQPELVAPETTFDDRLHPVLFERYRKKMPIIFEAPVFEIGTKRDPEESKRVIEEIIASG